MALPFAGAALGLLGKHKWPLIILGVVLYTGTISGWCYMKGREAILNQYAEAREEQYEKRLELRSLEDRLNRELARAATLRETAQEEREKNAEEWRKYVKANPDLACSVRDDDGLRYIQGIFQSR